MSPPQRRKAQKFDMIDLDLAGENAMVAALGNLSLE